MIDFLDLTLREVIISKRSGKMKKFICLMLVLVITFSFSACGSYEPIEPTTSAPATEIEPETIFSDYYNNQLTADEKYLGQRYKITDVTVSSVNEEYVYIEQKIVGGKYCIELIYDKSQLDYVKSLSKGDLVAFEGTLTEIQLDGIFMPQLDFENVVFIEKSE